MSPPLFSLFFETLYKIVERPYQIAQDPQRNETNCGSGMAYYRRVANPNFIDCRGIPIPLPG